MPLNTDLPGLPSFDDAAWVEVLQKTEEAYARSVQYQVELERKNEELEQAHQFIQAVLSAMSDILVVLDNQQRIIQVNRACVALSGFPEDKLLGQSLEILFELSPEQKQQLEQGQQAAQQDELQVMLRTAQGHTIPMAIRCSCQDASHCPVNVGKVIVGRPVGELLEAYASLRKAHEALQKAQQQVIQSEKMAALGRLVAGVAHELNNPVSFVYANLKTLRFYLEQLRPHCAQAQPDVQMIWSDLPQLLAGTEEGIERISHLIDQLKQFTRTQQAAAQPLVLKHAVDHALKLVIQSCPTCSAPQIENRLDNDLKVLGVENKLQQILLNLFQNAMDAMHPNPLHLQLSATCEAGKICLQIRDFGPGISPKHLDKIFEPFFTTKEVGKGTGLGLSISHELAQEMGGSLSAWNHAEGGAVFQLCLPEASL